MNALTPWAVSACSELTHSAPALFAQSVDGFTFLVTHTADSLWIIAEMPNGGRMAFRAAYSPGSSLKITDSHMLEQGVELQLSSDIGAYVATVTIDREQVVPVLRYTTTLTPAKDLLVSFWPRDVLATGKSNNPEYTAGKIHARQQGTRSGFLYMTMTRPRSASILYLQNLTALADYCEQTQTSCAGTVGGEWPELGFALPPAKDKPLPAGKEVCICDALVAFDPQFPDEEPALVRQYLELLGRLYLLLPKPDTLYRDWPVVLSKGLHDLIDSPGCWSQVAGHQYFNAYVSDYKTPPEIMVQLAILLPLLDYVEWNKSELKVMKTIRENLSTFYDEKLGTIRRWLPAAADKLEAEEEQKHPDVMDSWYLHHPLLNLARLALKGDKEAARLFTDSAEFAIKVAHHFNYHWPVFYNMKTLEVIKAETAEGKGGEKDVAGLYAHVMLQAWELTDEKRYLREAEQAAKTLEGYGFEVFYQANNTAFSAAALLRLYKITQNELYLHLSNMCLASIFQNTQLWDCNYGHGKHFSTFFALYPLNDAPYTAAYEEQEVFCALHDYLKHADGVPVLPSIRILTAEYIRYLVYRAVYYYPTMLPKEMLADKPKVGELDNKLWIALEDLQDGWLKSGTVGQEVYGAGNAFGILPRHYMLVPDEEFMVYVDYPTAGFNARKGQNIHFQVLGDSRLQCRMMIVRAAEAKLPKLTVTLGGSSREIKGNSTEDGNMEYIIHGDQQVHISWPK
ncbi:hypothetical protein F0L74_19460 [Chitinophaga agrisoli]|uniref:Uncharacterized protein n=1 Tax=Chitinophaga agrisoli TaxID=2607653 RepID=A0A5B2VH21_9BACT|nr:hypothetical protein [Chitinophaga agrisoli]KAA2238411.1 hypothetical protein F0L74_19460 [Chitinophaga agrisoli]